MKLNPIQETLLIPLYFRALESSRANSGKSAIINDELATKIIKEMPYNYEKFKKARFSKIGCCVRAKIFDEKIIDFITSHKNPAVIILGSGLDTCFYRILARHNNKEIANFKNTRFYEVDLIEVIKLRKKLIPAHKQDVNIACSILESRFLEEILESQNSLLRGARSATKQSINTTRHTECSEVYIHSNMDCHEFSNKNSRNDEKLALIRINNIKNANLDMSNAVFLKSEAKNLSPKDKVKQNDILISMSGSIGLSCVVRENINAMINQRILKISIENFNTDVLVIFLNSIFGKLQFERIGTGGVQTNISSSDMQNILIPKIDLQTQEKIAQKIKQSFSLRAKSKDLLQSAKAKVQSAIESK